jgi:reactive intermediate/imine deaminase
MRQICWAAAALLLSACVHQTAAPRPEYLAGPRPSAAPFSPAVRVGNMLYLAGEIGTDSTGHLAPGGVQAETRQALTNISQLLARNGSSMDRVVSCTVFMADMKEWAAMNQVYATFFPVHKPARSAVGVTGLAANARLEIECTAVAG